MVSPGDSLPQLTGLPNVPVGTDDGEALVQDRHHRHELGPHLAVVIQVILSSDGDED